MPQGFRSVAGLAWPAVAMRRVHIRADSNRETNRSAWDCRCSFTAVAPNRCSRSPTRSLTPAVCRREAAQSISAPEDPSTIALAACGGFSQPTWSMSPSIGRRRCFMSSLSACSDKNVPALTRLSRRLVNWPSLRRFAWLVRCCRQNCRGSSSDGQFHVAPNGTENRGAADPRAARGNLA